MLPSLCVISDSKSCDNITDTLKQCIDNGANWIGVREYNMGQSDIYNLCEEIIVYSENNNTLISVWNNPQIAHNLKIALHMPSTNIDMALKAKLNFDSPLGFSTHNEIEIAQTKNADYITISPVFDSISKTGYTKIGLSKFYKLCAYANCPVFALGGIDENNISQVFEYGAYGAVLCGSAMKNPKILNNIKQYL